MKILLLTLLVLLNSWLGICIKFEDRVYYDKPFLDLPEIPDDIPDDATNVNLMFNNITKISPGTFLHVTQLLRLVLTENEIFDIEPGIFPSSLQVLDLSNNKITNLADGVFQNLMNLEELDLGGNRLQTVRAGMWRGLNSLWRLRIQAIGLTELRADMFTGLESTITSLGLDNNEITEIPDGIFKKLSHLQILKFSYNNLTEVRAEMFEGIEESLEYLGLMGNRIHTIHSGAFSGLIKLKDLNLMMNKLTSVEQEDFPLCDLSIGGNEMQCDESLCWLKKPDEERFVFGPDCINYGGMYWQDVGFHCDT